MITSKPSALLKLTFAALVLIAWSSAIPVHAATLKIATISPDGSLWMKGLRDVAAKIKAETNGSVIVKYYPGGVMGDDKTVLRKIRIGQLHGAVVTVGVIAQQYPDIQIYGLPMVFRSSDELDYVRQRMDPILVEGLRAEGFESFGLAEIGFAYTMSASQVASVDDVRAQKVWVPDGDLASARALAAYKISPIPLGIADVLGGLQTGLINTIAGPPVGAIALQWHTRLKHVVDLPLLYTYGLLAVSNKAFAKLNPQEQAIVRKHMTVAVKSVDTRSRADHEQAIAALKKQGLVWHEPNEEQRAQWQSLADTANSQMVSEGFVTETRWKQMMGYLAEVR